MTWNKYSGLLIGYNTITLPELNYESCSSSKSIETKIGKVSSGF